MLCYLNSEVSMNLTRRELLWLLLTGSVVTTWTLLLNSQKVLWAVTKVTDWVSDIINLNPDSVVVREFVVELSKQNPWKYVPVGMRIWVISDLHIDDSNAAAIKQLEQISNLNLDLLIITWDFISAHEDNEKSINENFSLLDYLVNKMQWKIFAVLWNHDYLWLDKYWPAECKNKWLVDKLKSWKIELLDNDSVVLDYKWERITVVWKWSYMRWNFSNNTLPGQNKKWITILVTHEPIWFDRMDWDFQLWIAWHMHGCSPTFIKLANYKTQLLWKANYDPYTACDYKFNNGLYVQKNRSLFTSAWIWRNWEEKFLTQRSIDVLTIS